MNEDEILKGLKNLRLSTKEQGEIRQQISLHMKKNPVMKDTFGSLMSDMEQDSLKRLRNIRLSKGESRDMMQEIRHFMNTHPIGSVQETAGWFSFANLRFVPSMAFALMLLVGCGGVSAAAQNALPGDPLYPIKLYVNEFVESSLHVTTASRAAFEEKRTERRLAEARALAKRGALSGETRAEIAVAVDMQATRTREATQQLSAEGQADVAVTINNKLDEHLDQHIDLFSVAVVETARNANMPPTPGSTSMMMKQDAAAGVAHEYAQDEDRSPEDTKELVRKVQMILDAQERSSARAKASKSSGSGSHRSSSSEQSSSSTSGIDLRGNVEEILEKTLP